MTWIAMERPTMPDPTTTTESGILWNQDFNQMRSVMGSCIGEVHILSKRACTAVLQALHSRGGARVNRDSEREALLFRFLTWPRPSCSRLPDVNKQGAARNDLSAQRILLLFAKDVQSQNRADAQCEPEHGPPPTQSFFGELRVNPPLSGNFDEIR